jgi:hypothetical protein
MKTTKKKSPKKPAPKVAAPRISKVAASISKEQLHAIVQRLEAGQSALIAESKRLGYPTNTPLRAALRAHLGGPKQYRAMIERGMKARGKEE